MTITVDLGAPAIQAPQVDFSTYQGVLVNPRIGDPFRALGSTATVAGALGVTATHAAARSSTPTVAGATGITSTTAKAVGATADIAAAFGGPYA